MFTNDKVKMFTSASRYSQITLTCSVLIAILVICLESVIASKFLPHIDDLKNTPLEGIPVYLMIFLFSQIFQVVLCWDAVFHQNTIQIIGFVLFNFCCFVYSLFQYVQLKDAVSSGALYVSLESITGVIIAMSIILGVFVIACIWFAFKLYLEFGWKIYKKIGADPHMKNMYRSYQIFMMILKLDVFFFLAFSVQFLVLVLVPKDPEFGLTIFAIPCTIVVISAAVYGLRQENMRIMGFFLFGCMLAMAYFIFKLARMYEPSQVYKYVNTRKFLTFFASLSLLFVVMTTLNAVICMLNFGKGLKQHVAKSDSAANCTNSQQEQGAGVVSAADHSNSTQMSDRKMDLS